MRITRALLIALSLAATPAMAQQNGVTTPDPALKNALAHPRLAQPVAGPERDVQVVCVAASCHDLQMKIGDMAREAGWNVFYVVKGPAIDMAGIAVRACADHLPALYNTVHQLTTASVVPVSDGPCNPRSEAVITLGP